MTALAGLFATYADALRAGQGLGATHAGWFHVTPIATLLADLEATAPPHEVGATQLGPDGQVLPAATRWQLLTGARHYAMRAKEGVEVLLIEHTGTDGRWTPAMILFTGEPPALLRPSVR